MPFKHKNSIGLLCCFVLIVHVVGIATASSMMNDIEKRARHPRPYHELTSREFRAKLTRARQHGLKRQNTKIEDARKPHTIMHRWTQTATIHPTHPPTPPLPQAVIAVSDLCRNHGINFRDAGEVNGLGLQYYNNNDNVNAEKLFAAAVALSPHVALYRLNHASTLINLDLDDAARAEDNQAIALGYTQPHWTFGYLGINP